MNESILYQTPSWLVVLLLFFIMFIFHWLGYMLRKREFKKNLSISNEGISPITSSLLALLALLLSFTFNMAASRYDNRRTVIFEEANYIRTVILLADMYPVKTKKILDIELQNYLECRIKYYTAVINYSEINHSIKESSQIFNTIWNQVMLESQNAENLVRSQQMIPALNNMINIVTKRDCIKNATVPNSIWWLLFIIILFASFTIGYSNIGKQKNHILAFVFTLSVIFTVFLILNLDRPRRGITNLNGTEQKIVELRSLFEH